MLLLFATNLSAEDHRSHVAELGGSAKHYTLHKRSAWDECGRFRPLWEGNPRVVGKERKLRMLLKGFL